MSNDKKTVQRLSELTGIDTDSVQTQILPFLSTFTTPDSLRVHLVDLLGSSTRAKAFITEYVQSRFPSSSTSATAPIPTPVKQPKLTAKQRALQPAKVKRVINNAEQSQAFGPVGTVYHKDRDFALDGYKPTLAASSASSSSSSPKPHQQHVHPGSAPSNFQAGSTTPVPAALASTEPSNPLPALQPEDIAPTPAMKEIDALIAELDTPTGQEQHQDLVVCFCHGRVHPLHPHQPLCPSCALPLCTSLSPSPFHPLSRCPSCARSPIIPSDTPLRTQLLASLDSKRLALEIEERQRIQRVRKERKLRDDDARERASAAAGAFPTLGAQPSSSGIQSQTSSTYGMPGYGARSNAVALALGRRAPTEAERSALSAKSHRVLRIPAKNAPSSTKKSKKKDPLKKGKSAGGGIQGGKENKDGHALVTGANVSELDEKDDDVEEEGEEVTITILVPDPEDDGWHHHEQGQHQTLSAQQQAAVDHHRSVARSLRPLINLELEEKVRPVYTPLTEREARRKAWEQELEEEEEEVEEGQAEQEQNTVQI
ncbi:hypothetical protein OC846_001373 [Tilletia horrida]|uniref:TRIP4/RQT4 C2HC5-type zinc finger domain-containing protein n=1 Tax=Tilletia horrida TaxID=155126 RepID=A0AAN6GU94_9BASI|nr:hypothetical protein OC845_004500 [Tilletia horrida]KAK0556154.1 hypothetical protein OC846_001373 [Tilletia horrida]KAK0569080.1 hypothetical protein OC861_001322 [Tilletia horrida]